MPELRPFRGIRYAPVGPLKEPVCPPYDIITPEEQIRLHERNPYNAVRIELPFSERHAPAERYEKLVLPRMFFFRRSQNSRASRASSNSDLLRA